MQCAECKTNVQLDSGNWLSCSVCDLTYHKFCIDPIPLDSQKAEWICPLHIIPEKGASQNNQTNSNEREGSTERDKNSDSELDEDDLNSMILFPYEIIPQTHFATNRRTKRTPAKAIQVTFSFPPLCTLLFVAHTLFPNFSNLYATASQATRHADRGKFSFLVLQPLN